MNVHLIPRFDIYNEDRESFTVDVVDAVFAVWTSFVDHEDDHALVGVFRGPLDHWVQNLNWTDVCLSHDVYQSIPSQPVVVNF